MLDAAPVAAPQAVPHSAPLGDPEPDWITRAAGLGWEWARTEWTRKAAMPGAWFDHAKADAVVLVWPKIFRLTDDRFTGQPFHLAFWEEVIVRLLIGWKHPIELLDPATGEPIFEHVRIYRRLLLWVPRKNGKTEFLAALSLLFFLIEGVPGGQGFCFARDEKQGRIVFDKMAAMIGINPDLARGVAVYGRSLWAPQIRSKFELLTGRPDGKHGKSPTVITGDEMHEWISRDLETFLRQGTGARLQPIELYASTAGLKTQRVGVEMFDETQGILDGRIEDASSLPVIFAAHEDDDWHDEAVWRRANPNLGLSPTLHFLRLEYAKTKDNARAEAHFRRYHLNQWVENVTRWIPPKKWDACTPALIEGQEPAWRRFPDELRGRPCFAGLDVSSSQDITALVLEFPPREPGERVKIVCQFWCPEGNIEVRTKNDRVDYERFARRGALLPTPGDYVDQSFVQEAIVAAFDNYDIQKFGFDPWNARKLYTDLVNAGYPAEKFIEVRQGIQSLGEGTKAFEKDVFAGVYDHGGHPVMRWMALNAIPRFDSNMNFKPDKKLSREKIDGVVAAVIARAIQIEKPEEKVDGGFVDYN